MDATILSACHATACKTVTGVPISSLLRSLWRHWLGTSARMVFPLGDKPVHPGDCNQPAADGAPAASSPGILCQHLCHARAFQPCIPRRESGWDPHPQPQQQCCSLGDCLGQKLSLPGCKHCQHRWAVQTPGSACIPSCAFW